MAVRDILEYPDPRLRLRAEPVTVFDRDLSDLVDDLLETLETTEGLGLSATQIDSQLQVLVLAPSQDASAARTYVNPKILSRSAWGIVEESCLSVPDIVGNVIRATNVRVSALNRNGDPFEQVLAGMDAVCMQHEMDHLAGKLFIDRLSIFRRLRIRALARKKMRQQEAAA